MVMAGTLMSNCVMRVMKFDVLQKQRQRPLPRPDITLCRLGTLPLRRPGYMSRQAT
jgi:hypothetical protein